MAGHTRFHHDHVCYQINNNNDNVASNSKDFEDSSLGEMNALYERIRSLQEKIQTSSSFHNTCHRNKAQQRGRSGSLLSAIVNERINLRLGQDELSAIRKSKEKEGLPVLNFRNRLVQHEIRRLRRKVQIQDCSSFSSSMNNIRPSQVKLIQKEKKLQKSWIDSSRTRNQTRVVEKGTMSRSNVSALRTFQSDYVEEGTMRSLDPSLFSSVLQSSQLKERMRSDGSFSRIFQSETKVINNWHENAELTNFLMNVDDATEDSTKHRSQARGLLDDDTNRIEKLLVNDEGESYPLFSTTTKISTSSVAAAFDPFLSSTSDDFTWDNGIPWTDDLSYTSASFPYIFDESKKNDCDHSRSDNNQIVCKSCSISEDDACSKETANASNTVQSMQKMVVVSPEMVASSISSVGSKSSATKRLLLRILSESRRVPRIFSKTYRQSSPHDNNSMDHPRSLSTDQTSCRSSSIFDNPNLRNSGQPWSDLSTDTKSSYRRRNLNRINRKKKIDQHDSEKSVPMVRNLVAPCSASKAASKEWLRSANVAEMEYCERGSYHNSMEMVFFEEIHQERKIEETQ